MTPFLSLPALRSAVGECVADLEHVRRLDTHKQVHVYLTQHATCDTLHLIAQQAPYWTVDAYLRRAMAVCDAPLDAVNTEGQTVRLLTAVLQELQLSNTLASRASLPLEAVVALAESAAAAHRWPLCSVAYTELSTRAAQGDDAASHAVTYFQTLAIPDIRDAQACLVEAAETEALLHALCDSDYKNETEKVTNKFVRNLEAA